MNDFEIIKAAFIAKARQLGGGPHFWDKMTKCVLSGEIKGIDPKKYVRVPKSPSEIARDMYLHLNPTKRWEDVSLDEKIVYFEVIKIMYAGMGFQKDES